MYIPPVYVPRTTRRRWHHRDDTLLSTQQWWEIPSHVSGDFRWISSLSPTLWGAQCSIDLSSSRGHHVLYISLAYLWEGVLCTDIVDYVCLSDLCILFEYVFFVYEDVHHIRRQGDDRSALSIDWYGSQAYRYHDATLLHDDTPLSQDDPRSTLFSRASIHHLGSDHIFHDHECEALFSRTFLTHLTRILPRDSTPELDTRDICRGDMVWGIYAL